MQHWAGRMGGSQRKQKRWEEKQNDVWSLLKVLKLQGKTKRRDKSKAEH
jgi:hypothetical protein